MSICALCAAPINGDPDAMALICKNGHDDVVHDKCYKNRYSNEAYKKAQHGESTKYGRGPAKERCLHDGCASFVKIKSVTKIEEAVKEPKQGGGGGGGGGGSKKQGAGRASRRREEDCGEYVEEEIKCQGFKADGTRCGRALFDKELLACRLHVDALRKQKEFAIKAAAEAVERERQAELELQAARERPDDELPDAPVLLPSRENRSGIAIEIGVGPAKAEIEAKEKQRLEREKAAAKAAKERAAAAPIKPAKWAAAEEGTNAKKGWNAAEDKTGLEAREDCPICLEDPGDIEMRPCGHTCCGSCLDQWMSTKSSFASTLRAGSSDTTCPLCRQTVTETCAAKPSAAKAASNAAANKELAAKTKEDDDSLEVDWVELARQRQAEVLAQARAVRAGEAAPAAKAEEKPAAPKAAPAAPAPPAAKAPAAAVVARNGGAPGSVAAHNGPVAAPKPMAAPKPVAAPGPVATPGLVAPSAVGPPGPVGCWGAPGPVGVGAGAPIGPPRQQSPIGQPSPMAPPMAPPMAAAGGGFPGMPGGSVWGAPSNLGGLGGGCWSTGSGPQAAGGWGMPMGPPRQQSPFARVSYEPERPWRPMRGLEASAAP